jgi:hypothetical protein
MYQLSGARLMDSAKRDWRRARRGPRSGAGDGRVAVGSRAFVRETVLQIVIRVHGSSDTCTLGARHPA